MSPPAVAAVPTPLPPAPPTSAMPAPAQPTLPSPPAHPHTKTSSPVPKSQALSSKSQATLKSPPLGKHRLGTVREVHLFLAEKSADPKSTDVVENLCAPHQLEVPVNLSCFSPRDSLRAYSCRKTSSIVGGSVIGQIEPDVCAH